MSYDKPIILRGIWRPTNKEVERLKEYTNSRSQNRPTTLFVPGRQIVSFELAGRAPVEKILPGVDHFVDIQCRLRSDQERVRRVVRVFPSDEQLPERLPNVDLGYMLRPITVLEAWRATRRPVALVRNYRRPKGGQDRMKRGQGGGTFRVEMRHPGDQAWMGEVSYEWQELQSRLDQMDQEKGHVERPDWKLASPLRDLEEHR